MKIGIFGGSFNPPHMGHINSLLTVQKKMGLDFVYVVPTSKNPLKFDVESPTAEHRLEMVKRALASYGNQFKVSDIEVKRGGESYTIDTLKELAQKHPGADIQLIIGADNLEDFHQWKNWKEILTLVNLIVTTRPGFSLPDSKEEMPNFLKDIIADYDFNYVELTTGKHIQFISLQDIEISASELRKWLRAAKPVQKYLPLAVETYIKENQLYRPIKDKVGDYKKFTEFCAQQLSDKKGIQIRCFDLTKMSTPTEYAIIASGTSNRHSVALAENLITAVKEHFGLWPQGFEGTDEGRWVVVDYGSLIVHIFYDFVRNEYSLENLWKAGQEMQVKLI